MLHIKKKQTKCLKLQSGLPFKKAALSDPFCVTKTVNEPSLNENYSTEQALLTGKQRWTEKRVQFDMHSQAARFVCVQVCREVVLFF